MGPDHVADLSIGGSVRVSKTVDQCFEVWWLLSFGRVGLPALLLLERAYCSNEHAVPRALRQSDPSPPSRLL